MRNILIYCCCVLMASAGCQKYLDKNPDPKQRVPKTVSDLQALLDYSFYNNLWRTPSFGEASADDYFLPDAVYGSLLKEDQSIYQWRREPYNFPNDWSAAALPIYNANFCIDGIAALDEPEQSGEVARAVKGAAHFFRAYYFLQLLWQHGKAYDAQTAEQDLGIVMRVGSDFTVPSVRTSVAEGYRQVIRDAHISLSLLPGLPAVKFRPSQWAASGLLARTYLSMRQYDSAYYYADQCLSLGSELLNYNTDFPFTKFNKEVIFYTEMNQTVQLVTPYYAVVDTMLYASYEADDLRRTVFFAPNGDHYTMSGNYTADPNTYFSGIAIDEMYLVRAECAARAGNVQHAMEDMNTLLVKRWSNRVPFVPLSAADANEALSIILHERRKELVFRGLRFIDIKRLNAEGGGIVLSRTIEGTPYRLVPNAEYYALPLPKDIVEYTGIPQN